MQLERVKDIWRVMYLLSSTRYYFACYFDFKVINLIWTVYSFCREKVEAEDGKSCLEIMTQ